METGDLEWTFESSASVGESSPVLTSESVLFGNEDGNIYSVDTSSGDLNWSHEVTGEIGPLAITGNMLFAASGEGNVYGFTFD
jgi:outer membrane protein assembly factor BamB